MSGEGENYITWVSIDPSRIRNNEFSRGYIGPLSIVKCDIRFGTIIPVRYQGTGTQDKITLNMVAMV